MTLMRASGWFAGFVRPVRVVLDFAGLFYLYIRSLLAHVHLGLAFWMLSGFVRPVRFAMDCAEAIAAVIGLFLLL